MAVGRMLPLNNETDAKIRVAAYCRISMDSEGQATSIDLQRAVYENMIASNPNWELVEVYADRGITGTVAGKRPEFQRMIADCKAGKIDRIITKSLSRFARNTMDCIGYIRLLQEYGVQVQFEKERITTGETGSELLLTILAAFAQEESRSISENIKWGFRKRFQQGQEKYAALYGYRKGEATNYEIVPEEAEVVRLIFSLYERGWGVKNISQYLNSQNIPSPREGKKGWESTRISYMLQNERYIGDVVLQKYFTRDHISHRILKNQGQLEQYYLEDHHPAIIEKEQFQRVNRILRMKSNPKTQAQYPVGDYLRCPCCGAVMVRRRLPIQRCETHMCCENVDCRKFVIRYTPISQAILDAYNHMDIGELTKLAEKGNSHSERFLEMKQQHPAFTQLDYYWLDELIDHITLGKHTYSQTELERMTPMERKRNDDRTLTIHWRCGIKTKVSSGVIRDSAHPKHIAQLWDAFVLRYPDRYPEITQQVLGVEARQRGEVG